MATGIGQFPGPKHRLAEFLGALSFASDLGIGLPMEYGARCCYISMRIADELRLSATDLGDLYYAELLKMGGCTCGMQGFSAALMEGVEAPATGTGLSADAASPLAFLSWVLGHMALGAPVGTRALMNFITRSGDALREGTRGQCEVAQRMAQRLGLTVGVQQALLHFCEQWDGTGMPEGLKGNIIPLPARMLSFSATVGFVHWLGGRDVARAVVVERRGGAFDPDISDAFLSATRRGGFWEGLEQETVWQTVLAMEPTSPKLVGHDALEEVALVLADYVDLKTPATIGHSRTVARLSGNIARRMNLPHDEVKSIEQAALIHDLGLAGVSELSLTKPQSSLSETDLEHLRMHPYHSERILSRVPGWQSLTNLVGMHHERIDGQGYYRGIRGPQIPIGARILAVADAFHELSEDKSDRPALDTEQALKALQPNVGAQLDPDCFAALAAELGAEAPQLDRRRALPAGLTEREVEVLQIAAKGITRQDMAARLFLSENTVRHHLESIYGKIGVSSRAGAVLFAVENELLN